ncbi:hypothetical protein FRC06_007897 [Ceratobasidium sp. 370]|nr:hypothetical protein FRC06_007897 [Ceratobasidium sp. 370]
MSFGIPVVELYNPALSSHRMREQVLLPSGQYHVMGKWDMIVEKDHVVDQQLALRRPYARLYSTSHPDLGTFTVELYAWTSDRLLAPEWKVDHFGSGNVADGFSVVCSITADLSGMRGSLKKQRGEHGVYYELVFQLCLEFGGVELKAFLEWSEKGITKRSDAKILVT